MRLKISTSLYVFAGMLASAALIAAVFAVLTVRKVTVGGPLDARINETMDFVADVLPPPLYLVEAYLQANLAVRKLEPVSVMRERIGKLHKEYDERLAHWKASSLPEAIKTKVSSKADRSSQEIWSVIERKLLPALAADDLAAALTALSSIDKVYADQRSVVDEIVADTTELQKLLQRETSSELSSATVAGAAILAALLLIVGFGSFFLYRKAIRPLHGMMKPLDSFAAGDFTVAVPGADRKDEVGQIADAVQTMANKVSRTIAEIKASGREVTNASAEIATSTTDLSQRTEEQAASLEETSAAMEELAATVRRNAENAHLANQDAAATREVADRGGKVVAKAVDAMARIEESSRKIGDIIGVIDEIARQTNLLALNAAVEAARAGEAGRGFAVVASEVRSLAQRSSQAAKDIKDLITNSNGQVKDGVELVNKAGQSLTEIVESIKKVAVVVSEIANASAEQATGIDQINKALTQMDEVTQQNSALVEENAATAKTLEHQAKAMDEQVSVFQIAAGHQAQAAAPAASIRSEAAKVTTKPAKAAAGPARAMQASLATAVGQDWKEF